MPSTELDLRIQALLLRASIYNVTDRPEQALTDLTQATSLSPDTYAIVYQKANTELELGDYTEAKADYIRLQRLNSRSTEALIGLARIAVKENNLGLANDYINQAVAIDPSILKYMYARHQYTVLWVMTMLQFRTCCWL